MNLWVVVILYIVNHTCAHSSDIVTLVGQMIHKEAIVNYSAIFRINHLRIHAFIECGIIRCWVVVIAHQCNPILIRIRSWLVLQHYAMETIVIDVKAIDFHIHIMLIQAIDFSSRQLGVVGPIFGRTFHSYISSRRNEMNTYSDSIHNIIKRVGWVALALRLKWEFESVVVQYLAFAHFHCLWESRAAWNHERKATRSANWSAIYKHLSAILVAFCIKSKVVPSIFLWIWIVDQIHSEVSWFTWWNVFDEVLFNWYFRAFYLHRWSIEFVCTRLVETGIFFAFVWARSSTALSSEDECWELCWLVIHLTVFYKLVTSAITIFATYIYT